MEELKNIKLNIADKLTISVLVVYIILTVINYNQLDLPLSLVGINLGIIIFIISTALADNYYDNNFVFYIRKLYPLFFILLIYGQVQNFIEVMNPELYDDILIEIDRWLFGTDPTHFLADYTHPLITEYLQIAYFSFYLLPVIHAIELLISKQNDKYENFVSVVLFTFYFSYLLYLFMPAVGPRFMLHEFANMNIELPGIFFTEFLRELINSGGGIPDNAINPVLYVNRDCMPSGHTMVTLVVIFMVFKNNSKYKYIILTLGISLIFGTVYLRYHYVIDVIAGIILIIPILIFRKFLFFKKSD